MPRGSAALSGTALGLMMLIAGCGGSATAPASPTATLQVAATPLGSCRPASTDGNGGPYPAAATSDCRGKKAVRVEVVADPKTTGGFAPSNITISPGTTVTFVWMSGGHNLHPFHDGIEDTGYAVSRTFSTIGRFDYSCQVHPGQDGVIFVR